MVVALTSTFPCQKKLRPATDISGLIARQSMIAFIAMKAMLALNV